MRALKSLGSSSDWTSVWWRLPSQMKDMVASKCRCSYTMCSHYQLKTIVNVWCMKLGVGGKTQVWEQCLQTWLQRRCLWSSIIQNTEHCFKDGCACLHWASATALLATLSRLNTHETQTKQIHIYKDDVGCQRLLYSNSCLCLIKQCLSLQPIKQSVIEQGSLQHSSY